MNAVTRGKIGARVEIVGKISRMPWQHMINPQDDYPSINYLDVPDGGQYVIYSYDQITCTGDVRVSGTIIEVKGKSKRPGSSDAYSELQVVVDSWECI